MKTKWFVEWSSANGRGNTIFWSPTDWVRSRVWKAWESAHYGCYVERLISAGEMERDEEVSL